LQVIYKRFSKRLQLLKANLRSPIYNQWYVYPDNGLEGRALMGNPYTVLGRILFKPLPHTPSLVKYLPSGNSIKRGVATSMAAIIFYSQAVCAGTASLPLLSTNINSSPLTNQTSLLERLMKLTGVSKEGDPVEFHESEFRDRQKLTDPGQDLETLKRLQERAEANKDIENQNVTSRGLQLPEFTRAGYLSPKEILEGSKIDALEKQLTPGDLAMETVKEVVETIRAKMKAVFASGTEFLFSVRKNFDGTYSRTYLIDGRANRILNSKKPTPHGLSTTQNIANMRYSRSHILVSMDIEHTDVKGRVSHTTRTMDYHDGAKAMVQKTQNVKEMWERTITAQGETKTLHRWDMNYDAKRNLASYQELSVDENDKKTERWWWGGTYDNNNNLIKYEELTREKELDTHVVWVATGYEKNRNWKGRRTGDSDYWGRPEYHLSGYEKTTVGPDGLEQKDVTTSMNYNVYSNLIHYERLLTTWDGKPTHVEWEGDYDVYDRAVSYKQTTTDWFGHSRKVEFSEGSYTLDDDLISYREKTTENGEITEKHFRGGVYDKRHNLVDYFQTETDWEGRVSAKHWTAQGQDLGYDEGDLIGYMEMNTYGPLTVKKTVTGITYDALHRQTGGLEKKRVVGIETDGNYTNVTLVTDTRTISEELKRGQVVLSNGFGVDMNLVEVTGNRVNRTILGTDNLSQDVVRDLTERVVRSEMNVHGDFREVKTETGIWGEEELEHVSETRRSQVMMDGFGRPMMYKEETTENGNPATWIRRSVDRMSFNASGNLAASHETTENSLGVRGEMTRSRMFYDQQNRLENYEMISTNAAEGSLMGTTAQRDRIGYNGLSDATTYRERLVRLGSTVVENIKWKGSYGVLGLVRNSDQVNRRIGSEQVNGETRDLDVSETTRTREMNYTRDGRSLRHYREELSTTASPDLVQLTAVDGATYDDYGRLATFNQRVDRVTAAAVGPDGMTIDEDKAVMHSIERTTRSEATFDALGGLTGYTESRAPSDGRGIPSAGSLLRRRNITFHPLGQVRTYTGEETRADSPDTVTEVIWSGTFDLYARPSGSVENRVERFSNGEIGLETQTVRENVEYDELGQMVHYKDTVVRSDSPQAATTVIWEKALFDVKGNLEGYREITEVNGRGLPEGLNNSRVLERGGTTYDGHGLLLAFRETVRNSAQPAVVVATQRMGSFYDFMGREIGSEVVQHESGVNQETLLGGEVLRSELDHWTTIILEGSSFNNLGQLQGFREVRFDGTTLGLDGVESDWNSLSKETKTNVLSGMEKADERVSILDRSGTTYNSRGLVLGYSESTRELSTTLDHNRGVERTGMVYTNDHQLTAYVDTTRDDATPGVEERVDSSNGEYNGFGQLEKTHEIRIQSGDLVSRSEGDRVLSYDNEGRVKTDHSVMVSDNGITLNRFHTIDSFNRLGLSAGERTVTTQTGVGSGGVLAYDIRTVEEKTEMGYDAQGRLIHSKDVVVSSDRPDVTETTLVTASSFNLNNQLISSHELKEESNSAGQETKNSSRTALVYDQKGRTMGYRDTTTGTADQIIETLDWTALGFSGAGQITGVEEIRHRKSQDPSSPYDVTTTDRREQLDYDLSGNLLSYEQALSGTEAPERQSRVLWDGTYDSLNRLASLVEETITTDKSTGGQVLNMTSVMDRGGMLYNTNNQLVGYAQIFTDAKGNASEVTWAGTFGGRGLVQWFEEETTDVQGNLSVKGQSDVSYDAAGRVRSFVQVETNPLGTQTVTGRTETRYDAAGLVGAMEEWVEETQPDGAKTFTRAQKRPLTYDERGLLKNSHETATVVTFDAEGVLVRERNRVQDWDEAAYNGLGQLTDSFQETVSQSLDGTFELVTSARMADAGYDILGQQVSYTQREGQMGLSREALVLPTRWDSLQSEHQLEWLENLTFIVGGEKTRFGELNLQSMDAEGSLVSLSSLPPAERALLLFEGKTRVNGEIFDLTTADVLVEVNGDLAYTQTETTYNTYGAVNQYDRTGTDNGVAFTTQWSATDFDRYNRVTADNHVSARALQPQVTTTRSDILYNANSNVVSHTEQVLNSATPDLIAETQVTAVYDALNRQTSNQRVTHQRSVPGALNTLDTVSTQIQEGVFFDLFDRPSSYTEIQFGGETLSLDGANLTWGDLSAGQKTSLSEQSVGPTDQVLQIATVAGIVYNEKGLQRGLIENRSSVGKMGGVLPGTNLPNAPPAVVVPSELALLPPDEILPTPAMDQAHLERFSQWLSTLQAHTQATGPLATAISSLVVWAKDISDGVLNELEPEPLRRDVLDTLSLTLAEEGGEAWGEYLKSIGESLAQWANQLSVSTQSAVRSLGETALSLLSRVWGEEVLIEPLPRVPRPVDISETHEEDLGLRSLPINSGIFREETTLVRSNMIYDAFNRVAGYLDLLFNVRDESLMAKTWVHDIDYNTLGQQIKMISDIHRLGVNLDEYQIVARDGVVYNDLGQMVGNRDITDQNGLSITTLTSNILYDTGGRMLSSRSVINKRGEEIRIEFQQNGQELTSAQKAALLHLYPGKSLGDLVVENVIQKIEKMVAVDDTVISETQDLVYDTLNRVVRSEETLYFPDGTQTKTTLKDVAYNERGQRIGTITEVLQSGSIESRMFLMDGLILGSKALQEFVKEESERTGDSVGTVFWGWVESGRLTESVVRTELDKVSEVFRKDIEYNTNGQMSHYQDVSSDLERGIEDQKTVVDLTYNRAGQLFEQHSAGDVRMIDGTRTVTQDKQTYRYDGATGLLLGAETVGENTTYPVPVWTDGDQDGTVDTLVEALPTTGKSRQMYGTKNGQLDMLFQESLQKVTGTEVPGRTVSLTFTTSFYNSDNQGRVKTAYGVSESISDDGYGNITTGHSSQLLSSLNGDLKTLATLSDSFTQNLDGSDNRTVMVNVNGYTESGTLVSGEGSGYYNGHEAGITDPEHVWVDGWMDANSNGILDDGEVDASRSNGVLDPGEMLWMDTDEDGIEDSAQWDVGADTYGVIDQSFVIIGLEAKLALSTSVGGTRQVNGGWSEQVLTTEYAYDEAGRLLSSLAQGSTRGATFGLTDTDTPPDGIVEEPAVLVATNTGTQEQFFVLINGQAKLRNNRAVTETVTATGSSQSDLTTINSYNAVTGALVQSVGSGTQGGIERALTDVDLVVDSPALVEIVVSRTVGTTTQSFAVQNGQARMVESVTTTMALDPESGEPLVPVDHRYSRSTTIQRNLHNALGQIRASSSITHSDQTTHVWTQIDTNADGTVDALDDVRRGEFVVQPSVSNTLNAYSIVAGQALVAKAITHSWSASVVDGVFVKLTDPLNHRFVFNELRVNYSYNSLGLLDHAVGRGRGIQTTAVWGQEDTNGNGRIDDEDDPVRGGFEFQFSMSESDNSYVILMGQAQVMTSVTGTAERCRRCITNITGRVSWRERRAGLWGGRTWKC
jgi:hypothetical protein